ncbi:MAG TPA: 5-formyltetrahydrofolate cyclo-ligase [Trueperaceae bacterium]
MTRSAPDLQRPPAQARKEEWRSWARAQRASVDPLASGRAIAEGLLRSPLFAQARHILTYLAFGGEPDLAPLLDAPEKTFYTTRTAESPAAGDLPGLTLHRLDPRDLERHRFGFLQPSPLAPPVPGERIDLVLVPGLAFDTSGNRLGFGMGYYDRLLATLAEDAPRIGVTTSALVVPRLPAEEHDVRMTHLATEVGLVPVSDGTE